MGFTHALPVAMVIDTANDGLRVSGMALHRRRFLQGS